MKQADEKNPLQSLVNELADLDSLLNNALAKANHLEKSPRLAKYQTESNILNSKEVQSSKVVKPANWGQLKNIALEDSVRAMEEDQRELVSDTTKVRQIKSKTKKLRIDNNWEDDPI